MAMVGKECVAIAADTRLGAQAQTISCDFDKVFQMGPKLFCGLPGLATDVLTVYERHQHPYRLALCTRASRAATLFCSDPRDLQ